MTRKYDWAKNYFSTDVRRARTKNVYLFHVIKMEILKRYRAFPVILRYLQQHSLHSLFFFCLLQVQNKSVLLTWQSHVQASFSLSCRLFIVYLKYFPCDYTAWRNDVTVKLIRFSRNSSSVFFCWFSETHPRTSKVVSLFSTWLTCPVFSSYCFAHTTLSIFTIIQTDAIGYICYRERLYIHYDDPCFTISLKIRVCHNNEILNFLNSEYHLSSLGLISIPRKAKENI